MKGRMIYSFLALCILLPLTVLIVWSFTARWPWPALFPQHFSLRGIQDILRQPQRLLQVVTSSLVISIGVAILSVIIAILTTRAVIMGEGLLNRLVHITLSLPFVIPVTVFATGIHQKMLEWGWANTIAGLILVHLIYSTPYASYLVLDAYESIGLKLEEQAWLLGANPWQAFRQISLPQLLPILSTALGMSFIVSFSQYFLTLMIGGGKIQTLAMVIFPYLQANDRTVASVYGLLFLLVTLLVMGLFSLLSFYQQRRYGKIYYF